MEKSKTAHVGRIRSPAAFLIGALVLVAATLAGARAPFWRSGFAGFLLLTILFGSPGPVFAQTESSNCDNTTDDDPIHCVIDGASETGDVSIDIDDIDVTATETGVAGKILNRTDGVEGNVTIEVNRGEIDVTGDYYSGIDSLLDADGKLSIDARNVDITTNGNNAYGVRAIHQGDGKLSIDVQEVDITTNGEDAYGVRADHQGVGDIVIQVQDGSIKTLGSFSRGVNAKLDGVGNVDVRITDGAVIETRDGTGVSAAKGGRGNGDIYILVKDSSITTGTNHAMDPSADSSPDIARAVRGRGFLGLERQTGTPGSAWGP